jgi:hypothetical protein
VARHKARLGFKEIAHIYPCVIEIVLPPGGLGRRLTTCTNFTVSAVSKTSVHAVAMMSTIIFAGALQTLPPLKHLRRNFLGNYCRAPKDDKSRPHC